MAEFLVPVSVGKDTHQFKAAKAEQEYKSGYPALLYVYTLYRHSYALCAHTLWPRSKQNEKKWE